MPDEDVTPDVEEQQAEAQEAHESVAGEAPPAPGGVVMTGEGNQPEGTGFAGPDTGAGESAESEIPTGVDEIEPIEDDDDANAPVDLANLDTGDAGGEGEAVDVSDAAAGDDADDEDTATE